MGFGYFQSEAFGFVTLLMALFLAAPLLFIALDYWAGVRKALQRGERITSSGMQRTYKKLAGYYNALFALVLVDTLQALSLHYFNTFHGGNFPVFPFITLVGALGVSVIEIRSIYEAADAKERKATQDVAKLLSQVIRKGLSPEALAELGEAVVKGAAPSDAPTPAPSPEEGKEGVC